jgi:hypothetical protein
MKARRLTGSISVASMLLGILGMAVFAQRSPSAGKASRARQALEPEMFSKRARAPAVPRDARRNDQEPITWTVQVNWALQFDDETRALHEWIASAIQAVQDVPETRTRFFSAVQDPPRIAIGGWGGLLRSVEPADGGGYIATVAVNVRVTSTVAAVTMVGYSYSERYFIDADGGVHSLESLDPLGMAGQEPLYYSSG